MHHRTRAGGAQLLVVLLVGLLCAGGYNYHRNWQAEQEEFRPYRSYSDADLEVLIAAYEGETDSLDGRYERLRDQRVKPRDRQLLGDQVREFERAQRRGRNVRETGAALSVREAELADLRAELAKREAERDELALHLRRLLTL